MTGMLVMMTRFGINIRPALRCERGHTCHSYFRRDGFHGYIMIERIPCFS
jgi:hypothetical protein